MNHACVSNSTCGPQGGISIQCMTWKSAACQPCIAGKYAAPMASRCVACPAGTFSNTIGATACLACQGMTYAENMGSTTCLNCQICPSVGYYKSGCNATSSGICTRCTG